MFSRSNNKRVRTGNIRGPEPILAAFSGLLRRVISPLNTIVSPLNTIVYDMLNKRFKRNKPN